jgi:hypothetical protein
VSKIIVSAFTHGREHLFSELLLLFRELYCSFEWYFIDPTTSHITAGLQNMRN